MDAEIFSRLWERSKMNYLAHLYLTEQTTEGLLGNLLGDFVGKAEELIYNSSNQTTNLANQTANLAN